MPRKPPSSARRSSPKTAPSGSPPEALRALDRWASLVDAPERWRALPPDEQADLGASLRDAFFCSARGGDEPEGERLFRALVALVDPEPSAHVEGLAASYYPSARFSSLRFVDRQHLSPAEARSRFACPRPRLPELSAVFVDPREFSFRTFENIIPLDRLFERRPVDLALTGRRRLDARGGCYSFAIEAPAATREALSQLDQLDLYVPPLNAGSRGGERYIFHSARLSEALGRAVRQALPAALLDRFSHVNPVFRCNRFEPGDERFHRHLDTPYFDRSRGHVSRYTTLLYLTGGRGSPALRFGDDLAIEAIEPLTCVVFDQNLDHEGAPYDDGRKVFLRTELIFEADALADEPAIGQLFAKACYLTGESLRAPSLAPHVDAYFNRAAEAHWRGAQAPDEAPEPFVHKRFRGVHFVANGYDFWFPKGALTLPECAALVLLDFFNCTIDGAAFRAQCEAEVVQAPGPGTGWIARLLAPHGESRVKGVFGRLDPRQLFSPPDEPRDYCCPFHCGDEYEAKHDKRVIERLTEAQRFARERLASAPIALLGQSILLDPAQFVVERSKIHVLSAQALSPVNFASCQGDFDARPFVGLGATIEALQPLVPPILFVEAEGCYHLMFDFFRNGWMIKANQQTVPIPEVIGIDLYEAFVRGADPWAEVQRRSKAGGLDRTHTGLRWWTERPVLASFKETPINVSDPTADPRALRALLDHDDPDVGIAAAGNPNLPLEALIELLTPALVFSEDIEDERSAKTIAAWQNPQAPLAMLTHTARPYASSAFAALLWLEHLHSVRQEKPSWPEPETDEPWRLDELQARVALWARSSPADAARSLEHGIVRAFARHLADLFSLPWPADEPS